MLRRYPESSFVGLIAHTQDLKATDERDYIYALLGCRYANKEDGQPLMEVDYTASVTSINYDIAKALLLSEHEGPWVLNAVSRMSRTRLTQLSHPTWVPQWTRKLDMLGSTMYGYKAGGSLGAFSARIAKTRYLQVSGFVFDKILWRSSQLNGAHFRFLLGRWDRSTNATELYLDRLWRAIASTAQELRLDIRREDFTRTLLRDYFMDPVISDEDHQADMESYRKVALALLERRDLYSKNAITEAELSDATWISNKLDSRTHGRSLFLTRGGRFGLGPGGATAIGDLCTIVMGGTVPFLLTPGDEGRYRLVEECYVHGAMGGELLGQFQPTTIVIE